MQTPKPPSDKPKDKRDLDKKIASLSEKLSKYKPADDQELQGPPPSTGKDMALGMRLMIDLMAGIGVGVLIGWWLDQLLNIRPLMMILFTILGFAAGVLNMVRQAKRAEAQRGKKE